MSERRMMSRKITDHDDFISLSSSAQALYMHLNLSADDEGFCSQVSVAMFKAHASTQDLESLIEKRYLMRFESGVLLIKHWKLNNSIRKDRFTPTTYIEEKAQIVEKTNGVYSWLANGCQSGNQRLSDGRIEQGRLGEFSLDCSSKGGTINILKMLTQEETESLFATYEDADYLIDEVENEINLKMKGNEIQDFYRYIIGYATNKGWLTQEV